MSLVIPLYSHYGLVNDNDLEEFILSYSDVQVKINQQRCDNICFYFLSAYTNEDSDKSDKLYSLQC